VARILLIDDDPDLRNLVRTIFERTKSGHEIVEASDALQGIEIYRSQHADLVIMDMIMPKKLLFVVKDSQFPFWVKTLFITAHPASDQGWSKNLFITQGAGPFMSLPHCH
jgi:CheY-like chemotaxis protein